MHFQEVGMGKVEMKSRGVDPQSILTGGRTGTDVAGEASHHATSWAGITAQFRQ